MTLKTNKTPQFRILPILLVVVILAFFVRLFGFATGISTFENNAYAESKKEEPQDKAEMDAKEPVTATMKEDFIKEDVEEEPPKWRDSIQDDLEFSDVTHEVFEDLAARRKKLDARERELMSRDAILKATEQEIDNKFKELTTLKGEIEGLLKQQSDEEEARINSLVKIYEGMKPKDAARILDSLDLDVLMSVASKMSPRRLSPIMAAMNAERARTITIMLAEEKQLPSLLGDSEY